MGLRLESEIHGIPELWKLNAFKLKFHCSQTFMDTHVNFLLQ